MEPECREVLDDLERYLDHECGADFEALINRHLTGCAPCLERTDFERQLRALIASRCKENAPAGLLDRVLRILEQQP